MTKIRRQIANIKLTLLTLVVVAVALLLSACGPRVTVYLTGNDPKLTKLVSQLAEEYGKSGRVRPEVTNAAPALKPGSAAVLTIGIMAGPVAGSAKSPAFTDQVFKDAGVVQALSFENWGRVAKQRQAIALAWDPWGFTGRPADLPESSAKTMEPWLWKDPAHGGIPLVFAGRDPGLLSLRFLLAAGLTEMAAVFPQFVTTPQDWKTEKGLAWFKKFAMAPSLPGAVSGADNFGSADLMNFRKTPGKYLVLETFCAQASLPVQEIRRFRPLALGGVGPGSNKTYLVASVLAAALSGGNTESAKAASGFVAFLLNSANQQKLTDLTGFLPADYRAPGLNALAATARKVAIDVDYIVAIDPARLDYGTQTQEWAGLLAEIQRAPGSWEAIVKSHALKAGNPGLAN